AAGRLRRHGIDRDDLVAAPEDLEERRNGEFGRAHEDQAERHRVLPACLCAYSASSVSRFAALANFLITRERLSLEMWSMKSTPLRWSISCCRQVANRPFASTS